MELRSRRCLYLCFLVRFAAGGNMSEGHHAVVPVDLMLAVGKRKAPSHSEFCEKYACMYGRALSFEK